jgi:hypothetical protein
MIARTPVRFAALAPIAFAAMLIAACGSSGKAMVAAL